MQVQQRQPLATGPLVGTGVVTRQVSQPQAPQTTHSATAPCHGDACTVPNAKQATAKDCENFLDEKPAKAFYLNGIRTPEASAKEALRVLEGKTSQDIELIYNPTEGLLSDAAESIANLSGMDTAISRKAQAQFRKSLDKGEKVQIFAHSQGAAIAADALHKISDAWRKEGVAPAEIKRRLSNVDVVGFGGFTLEKNFPKGVDVELHRQPQDYIPKFADALCDVGDAFKSKEDDLGQSLSRFGKTISGFVGVNAGQAIKFLSTRQNNPKLDSLDAVCKTVGKAVGSDHELVVKDDFIRREFSAGYLDTYNPKAHQQQPVA